MPDTAAQRIGGMVANLLSDLERDYGDADVLDALIVVEVMPPPDPDDPDGGSIIEHRTTTRRLTIGVGLAEAALNSLLAPYERGDGD